MKDSERLELLKEVAGTRVYDERKEESKKIMAGAGWEKANAETKKKEVEKLEDAESEAKRLMEAIKDLERLKME